MGVPAFFRWLSEKYPKIVQDVLEERVCSAGCGGEVRVPFDASRPNPSGLECDNLYIDMNGIIHPCSHPEQGPQPATEEEMMENVCRYVDRLFRAIRPRQLLYLAIDGVAPRAKMNQQRARRFRAAQEARELLELERSVAAQHDVTTTATATAQAEEITASSSGSSTATEPTAAAAAAGTSTAWDSNVITPGTPFMLKLATFVRFYIRKRLAEDKAWRNLKVLFSDASVPGEGEHKIMAHVRLQRAQPGYNPNLVHVLHGLDADLIMLALATHEAHFYICREEVLFGRKSIEAKEQRQQESGFALRQQELDQAAGGDLALQLPENSGKPLQRISIPILRDYLQVDFQSCLDLPFKPSFERLIDDIVFLCFFVGNDFLPHLPSLDIRDGALDFLFNVYKRVLPSLGDYITKSGGNVNLAHVNVILQNVGAIEDYVFSMKHETEQRMQQIKEQQAKQRNNNPNNRPNWNAPTAADTHAVRGRAAKILEKAAAADHHRPRPATEGGAGGQQQRQIQAAKDQDNRKAAWIVKQEISTKNHSNSNNNQKNNNKGEAETQMKKKRKSEEIAPVKKQPKQKEKSGEDDDDEAETTKPTKITKRIKTEGGIGVVGDAEEEFDEDEDDDVDDDEEEDEVAEEAARLLKQRNEALKEKVKAAQQKRLDDFAKNVVDNVRLHESGWKDRYYSDKCKADDVEQHGGREHLFRSYVVGLVWVMKYYYDGCPNWTWYYPFHYGPFASDLQNIDRFQPDVRAMMGANSKPFNPVEQLMAVLPSDSAHAIPKAARWLMLDEESPIFDFYPKDVPVDPNGKAMPWLWVVLLPFIDENRLLDALHPTMEKWTQTELLCNARGLDDGYLYVHHTHPMVAQKLQKVLAKGKSAKDPKTRLVGGGNNQAKAFFGSVRPPLSNELYFLDPTDTEDIKIPLPPSASNIHSSQIPDGLFTDDIVVNKAVCVAFSEPSKLPHKSVLLPGAKPLPSILTEDDKRIRRPRLGRGGSIANMGGGGGNNQSHQSGYGSMNISQYERDLANRTGRGHQMNQAGTRTWGAMEPTPKQQRRGGAGGGGPAVPNPFMNSSSSSSSSSNQLRQQQQQPAAAGGGPGPPWQQQHRPQANGGGPGYGQQQQQPPPPWQQHHQPPPQQQWQQQRHHSHQQQQQQQWQQPRQPPGRWPQQQQQHQQQRGAPPQQHPQQPRGPHQPYTAGNNRDGYNINNGPHQHRRGGNPPPPPHHQPQQGFSFHNPSYGTAPQQQQQQQPQPPPQSAQQRSRASADAMENLRAQLSNTLQGQRRTGSGGGGGRA